MDRNKTKILTKARLDTLKSAERIEALEVADPKLMQTKIFKAYLTKRSINYDILRTKIYSDRMRDRTTKVMEWVAYGMVGAITGFTAACMTSIEEHMHVFRRM